MCDVIAGVGPLTHLAAQTYLVPTTACIKIRSIDDDSKQRGNEVQT